jgi:hypothetical protein
LSVRDTKREKDTDGGNCRPQKRITQLLLWLIAECFFFVVVFSFRLSLTSAYKHVRGVPWCMYMYICIFHQEKIQRKGPRAVPKLIALQFVRDVRWRST